MVPQQQQAAAASPTIKQEAQQQQQVKPAVENNNAEESKSKMPKIQKKAAAVPAEDPSVTQVQKKIAQFIDSKGKLSHQDYVLMFVKIMAAEKQEKARLALVNVLETATQPNCLKK